MAADTLRHSLTISVIIDVDELIRRCRRLPRRRVPIKNVKHVFGDRIASRGSGFRARRLEACNVRFPLIVTPDFVILDGRHRYLKLLDAKVKTCRVVIATWRLVSSCIVDCE